MTKRRTCGYLLRLASSGDGGAFADICVSVLPRLRSFVLAQCKMLGLGADNCDDLVHDTIIKAINWLKRSPEATVNMGWLFAVAKNAATDLRRSASKQRTLSEGDAEKLAAKQQENGDTDSLLQALLTLTPGDQAILRLVFFEGLRIDAAAAHLGLQRWTAYKRFQRALGCLRCKLQDAK